MSVRDFLLDEIGGCFGACFQTDLELQANNCSQATRAYQQYPCKRGSGRQFCQPVRLIPVCRHDLMPIAVNDTKLNPGKHGK